MNNFKLQLSIINSYNLSISFPEKQCPKTNDFFKKKIIGIKSPFSK